MFPKQGYPEKDAEMRKQITSIAMAGLGQILFDNVEQIGSPSFDAALTATSWQDRQLGGNQMTPDLPLRVTWFATGNNIILRGDSPRRVLHIRLESMEESPEDRKGFAHPNLLEWVRKNRGRLVVAALTILRGYVAAGQPDMKLRPWGSFERAGPSLSGRPSSGLERLTQAKHGKSFGRNRTRRRTFSGGSLLAGRRLIRTATGSLSPMFGSTSPSTQGTLKSCGQLSRIWHQDAEGSRLRIDPSG